MALPFLKKILTQILYLFFERSVFPGDEGPKDECKRNFLDAVHLCYENKQLIFLVSWLLQHGTQISSELGQIISKNK